MAQEAGTDQYVPFPPYDEPGGRDPGPGATGGGGDKPDGDGPASARGDADDPSGGFSPSAGTGQTDAGTLPFTGYPVTWVLLIALVLLVGGLALRFGSAGLRRLRDAPGPH